MAKSRENHHGWIGEKKNMFAVWWFKFPFLRSQKVSPSCFFTFPDTAAIGTAFFSLELLFSDLIALSMASEMAGIPRTIHKILYVYICIYIYTVICLFICTYSKSMPLSIYRSIDLSVILSICLFIYPSIHPSIHRLIDLSIYRSMDLSTYRVMGHGSIDLSVYRSISLSIYLPIYTHTHIHIYTYTHMHIYMVHWNVYIHVWLKYLLWKMRMIIINQPDTRPLYFKIIHQPIIH